MNIDKFNTYLKSLPVSKTTRLNYLSDVNHFIAWTSHISKTTRPSHLLVKKYKDSLKKRGLKKSTIKRKMVSIGHYAYFLEISEALPFNFMRSQPSGKISHPLHIALGALVTITLFTGLSLNPQEKFIQKTESHAPLYNVSLSQAPTKWHKKPIYIVLDKQNLPTEHSPAPNYQVELLSSLPREVDLESLEEDVLGSQKTLGSSSIPPGATEIKVSNPEITKFTNILITPTTPTQNQVIYIKKQRAGYFIAAIENPVSHKINFNWWSTN